MGVSHHGGSKSKALPVLTSKANRETDVNLDDIHSFILRISLNRAHGGHGKPRPQFHLEHVNDHTSSRFKSLQDVCVGLTAQVNELLERFDLADVDIGEMEVLDE